jgi:hypothetical protein
MGGHPWPGRQAHFADALNEKSEKLEKQKTKRKLEKGSSWTTTTTRRFTWRLQKQPYPTLPVPPFHAFLKPFSIR